MAPEKEGPASNHGILDNDNDPVHRQKDQEESLPVQHGRSQPPRRSSSAMDEDEFYPKTFQEELNEIMEAFYAAVSEEDIRQYQRFIESISQQRIAEGAVHAGSRAPEFELEDQDGERVKLGDLCKKGSVVLIFYRGKWCPHCNATIAAMSRAIDSIQSKGATLVAISPMLPDGTQYLASKRSLQFPVCSDVGNVVARKYKLTFEVIPDARASFLNWGEDVPSHNGDDSWEIPLPATYIVDTNGDVVWSFVDNDPSVRASPDEIVAAIPSSEVAASRDDSELDHFPTLAQQQDSGDDKQEANKRFFNRRHLPSTFKTSIKKVFGRKKQEPQVFLSSYLIP
jgi:peroxiredoxin